MFYPQAISSNRLGHLRRWVTLRLPGLIRNRHFSKKSGWPVSSLAEWVL